MSEERCDYAVLISLMTREEAEIAAGALRADGIDAFIGNSNHAYVDWFTLLALNGLQIFVPTSKLVEARQMLRDRIRENAQSEFEEPIERRDRYKAWLAIGWLLSGFVVLGGNPLQEAALRETYGILRTRITLEEMRRAHEEFEDTCRTMNRGEPCTMLSLE